MSPILEKINTVQNQVQESPPITSTIPGQPTFGIKQQRHIVRRLGFDIGSSKHKVVLADVDIANNVIVRILYAEEHSVYLNHGFVNNATLPASLLQESTLCITRYLEQARAHCVYHGADGHGEKDLEGGKVDFEAAGVATAVFRKAKNGQQHLEQLQSSLGVNLQIISQQVEGEVGYLTAVAAASATAATSAALVVPSSVLLGSGSGSVSRSVSGSVLGSDQNHDQDQNRNQDQANHSQVVVWDSGGGSFQIMKRKDQIDVNHHADTVRVNSDSESSSSFVDVFMGPLGDANVMKMIFDQVGMPFQPKIMPYPVTEAQVNHVIHQITDMLDHVPAPDWLEPLKNRSYTLYTPSAHTPSCSNKFKIKAIGGTTCIFRVAVNATNQTTFTGQDIWSAMACLFGQTTEQVEDIATAWAQRCSFVSLLAAPDSTSANHTKTNLIECEMLLGKLILLYSVMKYFNFEQVSYVESVGSCQGILIHPKFWKQQ